MSFRVAQPGDKPGPGQIEADSGDPCNAPKCGLPLDQHEPFNPSGVDGFPVGNDACAHELYHARRPMTARPAPAPMTAAEVRERLAAGTMPGLIPGVPHFGPVRPDALQAAMVQAAAELGEPVELVDLDEPDELYAAMQQQAARELAGVAR